MPGPYRGSVGETRDAPTPLEIAGGSQPEPTALDALQLPGPLRDRADPPRGALDGHLVPPAEEPDHLLQWGRRAPYGGRHHRTAALPGVRGPGRRYHVLRPLPRRLRGSRIGGLRHDP